MMSNDEKLLTLDALNGLTDKERQLALEILQQYAKDGESDILDNLKYSDFDEIPVNIDTFLHDPKYLGKALIDQEGRFTVFPYWEKCLNDIFPDNLTTKYNNIVFTGAIGLGKAQPLDSLVLTEDGYKKMGELTFDDMVYGADGKLHRITGIFPQGKKKVCKVSFTDGTSTLCCDEHLWTVLDHSGSKWQTLETKQLVDDGRYEIPLTSPVKFSANKPYDWLSDDIRARIRYLDAWLRVAAYEGGFRLQNDPSTNKTRQDLRFLIQSLGGTCVFKDDGKWTYIDAKLPKRIRKKLSCSLPDEEPHRYISNIEYVEDDYCQCITIDSKDHLYLTNDFIVTHNSTIAVICLLYMLYRLLCLKDPYLYYGLQPIDKITISLMNITLENAKGVALDKMNQMILASEWFMAHGTMGGTTNLIYRPEKHIEFVTASSNNQIIGRAIFANFSDEVNFGLVANPERQKKKMLKLITQIDARMKSRFMRGTYLPTLNILASSKDTEQSFLEEYIEATVSNKQMNTLIVDEPQWVVDSRKDTPEKFWVGIGNKFLANELLPLDVTEKELEDYRNKGYELWQVPMGYIDTFQKNLDEAIASIIGIATASSLKYISGEKINQIKTDSYRNPFAKDVIEVGNAQDDYLQYSNFFDMSAVSQEDLARPLFVHLDMSMTGDKTGIAGVWITGRETNVKRQLPQAAEGNTAAAMERTSFDDSEITNDLHYKLAFSVSVKAPKGAQVSFAKNMNFIRWLRDQGFAIKCVSMDTFQSASLRQALSADGFRTEIISVDRLTKDANGKSLCLPYHFLKNAIYERRITMYKKCDLLTDELIGLERKSDGHIDHTKAGINCLSGDVLVSLADGRRLPIAEIAKEFSDGKELYVWSFDPNRRRTVAAKVTDAWRSGVSDDLVEVELGKGETLVCTANHRFMLADGVYMQAGDLTPGCLLKAMYGKRVRVRSVKRLQDRRDVYDLTVEGTHNFALGFGAFVHNSKDQADGFCGSAYAASMFSEEYSYRYGDNVSAILDANDTDDTYRKQRMIEEFEAELAKLGVDYDKAMQTKNKQRQEEAQYYADLSNGIIIL